MNPHTRITPPTPTPRLVLAARRSPPFHCSMLIGAELHQHAADAITASSSSKWRLPSWATAAVPWHALPRHDAWHDASSWRHDDVPSARHDDGHATAWWPAGRHDDVSAADDDDVWHAATTNGWNAVTVVPSLQHS